jgi:hypothetical protein
MPEAVGSVILANTGLDILMLPLGSRNPTRRTITATAQANVGATSITLQSSAANTVVKAGTCLSFATASPTERQLVVLAEDATIGTTPAPVSIIGLEKTVAANSTANFVVGLLPLYGIQSFELSSNDQTVDVTNTRSGFGTENVKVRSGRQYQISGVQVPGDVGLELVKDINLNPAFYRREAWTVITYPDGEKYEGASMIMNFSQPGNQNEVKKYSFQLQFQGDPIWTRSYYPA